MHHKYLPLNISSISLGKPYNFVTYFMPKSNASFPSIYNIGSYIMLPSGLIQTEDIRMDIGHSNLSTAVGHLCAILACLVSQS